jgi:hypothetical protein
MELFNSQSGQLPHYITSSQLVGYQAQDLLGVTSSQYA